jgi:hypoxanthine phosphoribosyltransferase
MSFHPDFDVEISRGVYLFLIDKLASRVRDYLEETPRQVTILGIAEGGKIIAHDLAQRTGQSAAFFFPKAIINPDKFKAAIHPTDDVILVDEIVDSGVTMQDTVFRLKCLGLNVVFTASLLLRSTSVFKPDYAVYTIAHEGWFRFWWDPEWYGAIPISEKEKL